MTREEIISIDNEYIMNTYGRLPLVPDHAEGSIITDKTGKEYVDFTSGIGVNIFGWCDKGWNDAIRAQLDSYGHVSNYFYCENASDLAKIIATRSGLSNMFFCNSGAEANEGAIKLARKYSFDKYGEGRSTIVTLNRSFHGRTVTTLAATGQDVFHNYFFPFTEGFRHADANDLNSLEEVAGHDVCAVMMELVQGEGGVLPLDYEYVQAVKKICEERDWLLLADEVQSGVGRTGSLFCFQQYDVLPDVVSFAKGIAGGLPMSGIMANEKCRNVLGPGTHATTFGANPICAAAGLYVQDALSDAFLEEVKAKGAYLRSEIEALNLPCFGKTRGMGLMIGVEVAEGYNKSEIANKLIEAGLLVLTAGPDMRLLPPLTITKEEMDKGIAIMKATLG